MMTIPCSIEVEAVNTEQYKSKVDYIRGYAIHELLKDRRIFIEKIATHIGRIEYPAWLGGISEIWHVNKTTVKFSYNPWHLKMPALIEVTGRDEDRSSTKEMLERLLNMELTTT